MQPTQGPDFTHEGQTLAVSLELATKSWKIGLFDGKRQQPLVQAVAQERAESRFAATLQVIAKAKQKMGMASDCRVVVVYEAGQDGFWMQRALQAQGLEAVVVDPASIPVERRARRAKTDRLDAMRLVLSLWRWLRGERDQMRVVRTPSVEAEAQRQLARDRGQLQKEVGQHRDRLRKLLRLEGCWETIDKGFGLRLKQGMVRGFGDAALPALLQERMRREWVRMRLAERLLQRLEKTLVDSLPERERERIERLQGLKAVGWVGAMRLVLELYWRRFDNRRQVGACVGLVSQPYDSGESRVDQGISKQGNRRVRALLIEMAWLWLRYQPQSKLSHWFYQRTRGDGANKRMRRVAIVAVARRLAIDLWRYLETGVLPAGAELKTS